MEIGAAPVPPPTCSLRFYRVIRKGLSQLPFKEHRKEASRRSLSSSAFLSSAFCLRRLVYSGHSLLYIRLRRSLYCITLIWFLLFIVLIVFCVILLLLLSPLLNLLRLLSLSACRNRSTTSGVRNITASSCITLAFIRFH